MTDLLDVGQLTATDYFALPEIQDIRELINGVIVVNTPFVSHQNAVGNLYFLLRTLVTKGKVYSAPLAVYFDDVNVLQPDILWVSGDENCVEIDGYLQGAPTLVVEVLSKLTVRTDKGTKYRLYELQGVQEYWMVDTNETLIEVYTRADNGRFVKHALATPQEPFYSPALGTSVNIHKIFE